MIASDMAALAKLPLAPKDGGGDSAGDSLNARKSA